MTDAIPITLAYGDGAGPEIVDAILVLLREARANITVEVTDIGGKMYRHDVKSGVAPYAWESMKRTHAMLKGPVALPPKGEFTQVNPTLIRQLSLHTSTYHLRSFSPLTKTPALDILLAHSNDICLGGLEEDLQEDCASRQRRYWIPMWEHSLRTVYTLAVAMGRRKITCVTRKNLFPATEGLYHTVFERVSEAFPKIVSEHFLLEDVFLRLTETPEKLDVLVTSEEYGTLLNEFMAQRIALPCFHAHAMRGEEYAVFGVCHGALDEHVGRHTANPSAMIITLTQLLAKLGQEQIAETIENAWLCALEDGIRTQEFDFMGSAALGTLDFMQAVVDRLGKKPLRLKPSGWTRR